MGRGALPPTACEHGGRALLLEQPPRRAAAWTDGDTGEAVPPEAAAALIDDCTAVYAAADGPPAALRAAAELAAAQGQGRGRVLEAGLACLLPAQAARRPRVRRLDARSFAPGDRRLRGGGVACALLCAHGPDHLERTRRLCAEAAREGRAVPAVPAVAAAPEERRGGAEARRRALRDAWRSCRRGGVLCGGLDAVDEAMQDHLNPTSLREAVAAQRRGQQAAAGAGGGAGTLMKPLPMPLPWALLKERVGCEVAALSRPKEDGPTMDVMAEPRGVVGVSKLHGGVGVVVEGEFYSFYQFEKRAGLRAKNPSRTVALRESDVTYFVSLRTALTKLWEEKERRRAAAAAPAPASPPPPAAPAPPPPPRPPYTVQSVAARIDAPTAVQLRELCNCSVFASAGRAAPAAREERAPAAAAAPPPPPPRALFSAAAMDRAVAGAAVVCRAVDRVQMAHEARGARRAGACNAVCLVGPGGGNLVGRDLPETGGGVLNHAALALKHLRVHWAVERVAVVDLAARRGDGTAALLHGDAAALLWDVHAPAAAEAPPDLFDGPSRGAAAVDAPPAPLAAGAHEGFCAAAAEAARRVADFGAEVVLLYLDFEHEALRLRPRSYAAAAALVMEAACAPGSACAGRCVAIVEDAGGGESRDFVANFQAVVLAMAAAGAGPADAPSG